MRSQGNSHFSCYSKALAISHIYLKYTFTCWFSALPSVHIRTYPQPHRTTRQIEFIISAWRLHYQLTCRSQRISQYHGSLNRQVRHIDWALVLSTSPFVSCNCREDYNVLLRERWNNTTVITQSRGIALSANLLYNVHELSSYGNTGTLPSARVQDSFTAPLDTLLRPAAIWHQFL